MTMWPMPAATRLTPVGVNYALLDSGHGRKLEQFGPLLVNRPEPQALWAPHTPVENWAAQATFAPKQGDDDEGAGNWQTVSPSLLNQTYPLQFQHQGVAVPFLARLTPFRHLGCFPDQSPQWAWLQEVVRPGHQVLNLFGYTGVASVVAALAGGMVTHVDASAKSLGYARENAALAGLAQGEQTRNIRWLCDDAAGFVAREVRRGKRYDVIVLDPPKYGRGPDGEVWEFFAHTPQLLAQCAQLLAPGGQVWLTSYALRASSLALASALQQACGAVHGAGRLEHGELAAADTAGRWLATAFFARWQHQPSGV